MYHIKATGFKQDLTAPYHLSLPPEVLLVVLTLDLWFVLVWTVSLDTLAAVPPVFFTLSSDL